MVELFRSQPSLAASFLVDAFNIPIPEFATARAEPCDFTDIGPREFRGDTAFALNDESGRALAGIVLEVQLCRDDTRRWSWPVYLATLRARLQCPTYLLVVTTDRGLASWCRKPIDMGHPGMVLQPLVLGPDGIPAVTDHAEAASIPERAVLSAMAHGTEDNADAVFAALLTGLRNADDEHAKMYYDLVLAALPVAAQNHLEELMTMAYEYQSDFARKYVAQGRTTEAAHAVLVVLEARGFSVPDSARDRINRCGDLELLETWMRRAATIATVDQIFE